MDFRVCTWFVSVRSCAVLICDSLFLSVPWYFLFKKFLHFFCRVTRSQILLKNNSSSWKRPFHFSKHFLSHQLIVFFRIHHPCDRIKWSNTLEAETTPKHFLLGMFHILYDVTFCDLFPITSPDMTTLLTLHQKVTFVGKQNFLPIFCSPFFVLFRPLKPFLSHFLRRKLLSLRPSGLSAS